MKEVKLKMYKGLFPLFIGMGELVYGNKDSIVTVKIKDSKKIFGSDDEKVDFLVKEAFLEVKRRIDNKEFDKIEEAL